MRGFVGLTLFFLGVALVGFEVAQDAPWQLGIALGVVAASAGVYYTMPAHCEDCDVRIDSGRYCAECARERRLTRKGINH